MNKKTIWIVLIIVVLIGGFWVFNNKKETTGPEETIKIGGLFILTGVQANFGELEHNGSKLAIDQINDAGGINGRRLEIVEEDTAYDPKKGLDAYNALKTRGIKIFMGDGSGVIAAVRKPIVEDGNFIMTPGATTPAFFDDNTRSCRIALTARGFGPALADLLIKRNYKKVVTLLPANEYGQGLSSEFAKAYTARGGKIVAAEAYDATPGVGDYRTNITKLKEKQSQADALVYAQVANTIEPMLKQIRDLDWQKPMVTEHYTIENPALKDLALANGSEFVTYDYSSKINANDSTTTKKFKEDYLKAYKVEPTYLAAGSYDTAMLVAEAISHVGEDPQKIGDYIAALKNYAGVTGTLSFNNDCEVERISATKKVEAGQIVNTK